MSGRFEGEAIRIHLSPAATAAIGNIRIEGVQLENFAGDYWINIANESATYPIENGWIDHDTFISEPGDTWGTPKITIRPSPMLRMIVP